MGVRKAIGTKYNRERAQNPVKNSARLPWAAREKVDREYQAVMVLKTYISMQKIIRTPEQPNFLSDFMGFPVCLATATDSEGKSTICPLGFWGMVNGIPPLYYISLCQRDQKHTLTLEELSTGLKDLKPIDPKEKEQFCRRYCSKCLDETAEVVINIPAYGQEAQWQQAGKHSLFFEPDLDKFALCGYTRAAAKFVKAPLIAECPINMECRVVQRISVSSHDIYLLTPLAVHTAVGVEQKEGILGLTYQSTPKITYTQKE
ncbi:MAG: hypothetical protein EZS28_001645 [Streblomastix strix]|uniref:Flavin reductase like domain-containing protein n=1 Tax=Streblomastix strix TaxID=222440 RepID=A0A5J4X891_9EUKA|nr:MAG: hypothetical protein EZS28_001645 [Streblomastix strix]